MDIPGMVHRQTPGTGLAFNCRLIVTSCICLGVISAVSVVRLVDGPTPYSGRVEVFKDGQWGTVCSGMWTENDAKVTCRELGYTQGGKAIKYAPFGEGIGSILMAYVDCRGNEPSLMECPHRSRHSCGHEEDAGVVCEVDTSANNTGRTRLADGTTNTSGRVEIQYNGVWGSVCRNDWNVEDSKVVCRDMGFCGGSSVMHGEGAFGKGSGPVWLTEVTCDGTEERLMDCDHAGWAQNDCEHYSDVGVVCNMCPTGAIRLEGSSTNHSGTVKISNNGVWGTVCGDPSWTDMEARVVCRSVGFVDGVVADSRDFNIQEGPIWLSGVSCTGWESRLLECQYNGASGGWGENDCRHYQDVAVNCSMTQIYTTKAVTSTTRPTIRTTTSTKPTTTAAPEGLNKLIIIVVSVAVGAIVVIVVVVAVVCGVTKIKTTRAKHSILLTQRGQANEYMVSGDVSTEGACAIALVPMKSHESGVYQEISDKDAANGCGPAQRARNAYMDEPTLVKGASARFGESADPLPEIPDDATDHAYRNDGGANGVVQDHYSEIPDSNADYLTPLKLKL